VQRIRGRSMSGAKEDLWPELLEGLHAALDADVEALGELVADLDLGLWPHFAHLGSALAR